MLLWPDLILLEKMYKCEIGVYLIKFVSKIYEDVRLCSGKGACTSKASSET